MKSVDENLLAFLKVKADELASEYDSSHNRNGADELEMQIGYYEAGMQGVCPADWIKYLGEYKVFCASERATYDRLKKKFEGGKNG